MAATTLAMRDTLGSSNIEPLMNGHSAYDTVDLAPDTTTSVWSVVSRWLPPRNADYDHWWQLTGPHLATLLFEAGYSTHEQYESMIFHYHVAVPRLGPRPPPSGVAKWQCVMTLDSTPIEYSWKWNKAGGSPEIRYSMEAIGPNAGTVIDPLNQESTRGLLDQLSLAIPSLDLTWFNHFAKMFFDPGKEKYLEEAEAPFNTSLLLSFEFLKQNLMVKTYFAPRKLGHAAPFKLDFWVNTLKSTGPGSIALDKVVDFLKTDPEGPLLTPITLAIDNIKPSKSRMKLYFQTPHTSFDSVRAIMTLGGKIQGVDEALADLQDLIRLTLSLDGDFPSSQETTLPKATSPSATSEPGDISILSPGYLYYFDVASGSTPDIKFYLPTRSYGRSDLHVAQGLLQWMDAHGRGQFSQNYMRSLEGLATHRKLDASMGVQTYISCAFQQGSLSVTTYLSPEAYHPQRLSKLNGQIH